MKKSTMFSALAGMACMFALSANGFAQNLMSEATLDYPWGQYSSFPPSSVSITWDNQPIEIVNPQTDEYGDQYAISYVRLGEGEFQEVKSYIMYSFGDPENPEDGDIWNLDIALYDLDDLWAFDGNTIQVLVSEGTVKNEKGELNPMQAFDFFIYPTCTEYTCTPETGATLNSGNFTVKVDFGGKSISYLQSEVRAMTYEPEYLDITLEKGKEVTISEKEITIDLSELEAGYYELVIPEGFVIVAEGDDAYLSPDMWLEYTIEKDDTGVTAIKDLQVKSGVYSLGGAFMGSETDSCSRLPQGIYIVNGKKVMVRK